MAVLKAMLDEDSGLGGNLVIGDPISPLETKMVTIDGINANLLIRIQALEAGTPWVEPTYVAGTYASILSSIVEDTANAGWVLTPGAPDGFGAYQYCYNLARTSTDKYFLKMTYTINGTTQTLEGMMDPMAPTGSVFENLLSVVPCGFTTAMFVEGTVLSGYVSVRILVQQDEDQDYPVVITSLELAPAIED